MVSFCGDRWAGCESGPSSVIECGVFLSPHFAGEVVSHARSSVTPNKSATREAETLVMPFKSQPTHSSEPRGVQRYCRTKGATRVRLGFRAVSWLPATANQQFVRLPQ